MTTKVAKNDGASNGSEEQHKPADRKSLAASVVGQLLEWFEWSSYAVFAPFIAAAMFDQTDPASALLATFGVFAIGFLARPLGGIIFGIIGLNPVQGITYSVEISKLRCVQSIKG